MQFSISIFNCFRDSSLGVTDTFGRETDIDDMDSLQHLQLSLPLFSSTVLLQALVTLHNTEAKVTTDILRLGFESWKILAVVIGNEAWTSKAPSSKELVSAFCLEDEWKQGCQRFRLEIL